MKSLSRAAASLASAALTIGLIAGCGSSSDGSAKVSFYTDMDPQEAAPLIAAFTQATGIEVELFTGGSAAVHAKWESEETGGVHNVDVVSTSGAAAYDKVETAGYIAAIPKSVAGDVTGRHILDAGCGSGPLTLRCETAAQSLPASTPAPQCWH